MEHLLYDCRKHLAPASAVLGVYSHADASEPEVSRSLEKFCNASSVRNILILMSRLTGQTRTQARKWVDCGFATVLDNNAGKNRHDRHYHNIHLRDPKPENPS